MRRAIEPTSASNVSRTSPPSPEIVSDATESGLASNVARGRREDAVPCTRSLSELLPTARFPGCDDIRFTSVADSADTAEAGQLVIYRVGEDEPLRMIADAIARGAAGILTEQLLPCPLPQCVVGDVAAANATIWSALLDRPDQKMLTIGVAGSAGKTTTALLIATLVRGLGVRTAFQTDLGDSDGIVQSTPGLEVPTWEGAVRWLGDAVDCGCEVAILEMADEPLRHGAYDAIDLDVLVLTGTLDPHHDFGPSGLQCAVERLADNGAVIASADDARAIRLLRDSGVTVVTYGVRRAAEVTIKVVEQADGMTTSFLSQGDTTAVMETPLCGGAMAANHAAAATFGILIGQPLTAIAEALGSLGSVPGRLQQMPSDEQANILIDAGGSPSRVIEALRTARSMRQRGRLWCVFAAEGNESPETLARYGQLIERFADQAILTVKPDAKPDFLKLSHQVLDGVQSCAALRLVADHERAVRWAVSHANSRDTILMLGGISGSHSANRPDAPRGSATAQQQRAALDRLKGWVSSERDQVAAASGPAPSAEADLPIENVPAFRIVG